MSNADLADFETKPPIEARPLRAGLIVDAVAWSLVLSLLAFVMPKFEAVFKDFGIELGLLSRAVVGASRYSLALAGLVVVLLVVDSIVRDALASKKAGRGMARAWSNLMLALPLTSLGLLVLSIGTSLIGLISKLSG